MNRIKRTCALLLAVVLTLGVALQPGIGGVFAANSEQDGENNAERAEPTTAAAPEGYICFDLAAGNITIGKNNYSGYVFVKGDPTPRAISSSTRTGNEKFYIYQSTAENRSTTGYVTDADWEAKKCTVPNYSRVKNGTQPWTKYIENNTEVKVVSENWDTAATNSGRTPTTNNITFTSDPDYTADVTIDNIWSTYYDSAREARKTGGITAHLGNSTGINIQLRLKGDNRFGNIHYFSEKGDLYKNQIIFSNGDNDSNPGSITVADFKDDFSANHWCSAIGGNDSGCDRSNGIVIESGVIYAGTTVEDNCTAIGGGGNEYGKVTIRGGTVTAVTAGTGTAIGGGIGYGDHGGDADVTIEGGTIYAYNLGITPETDKIHGGFSTFVPAAAIGGGGSRRAAGGLKVTITIKGGTIYAQSKGGPGIGGGGSASSAGGPANITITGGTIIAKSTGGEYLTEKVDPGVSIGGGTGLTAGGSVTLNIGEKNGEKTIIRAGSIGGGSSTGKDASGNPYKVGSANVRVDGGDIIGQVIMAGGAENPCSFTMTGGVIHSTDVINGVTIGAENITGVTVTDPRDNVPLSFKRPDGGAVFMNDPQGVAVITGGVIGNCTANKGGAVYMAGGTFILSGTGQLGTNHAKESGGSVYVGGGTVQIGGGVKDKNGNVLVVEGSEDASKCAIRNSDAAENGGGVYVVGTAGQDGATVIMKGGEIHSNKAGTDGGGMYIDQGKVDIFNGSIRDNSATKDGGGVYVAGDVHILDGSVTQNSAVNGGGFCVEDGTVLMYGGSISGNTATENGGGLYISAISKDPIVDIFSGSIINNKAKNGGGVSVISQDGQKPIHVTVGVNCVHPNLNTDDRIFTAFPYPDDVPADCGEAHEGHTHYHIPGDVSQHSSCPVVEKNIAEESGGGFYLKSAASSLVFYCIIEEMNQAQGNSQCYNMDVEGGHVEIGDKSYDYEKDYPVKGNIVMQSSILVKGGTVDIYGTMQNPKFTDDVTVDITKDDDHYIDHRLIKQDAKNRFYKVHYYENFKGDGDTPTGLYIARQYPDLDHDDAADDRKYDFTIMSSIFSRPGYKIVGWNSQPDDKGQKYEVNETYNFVKSSEVTGKLGAYIKHNNGKVWDDSLLVLYAIWERSGYVLKFDPNVGEGETYTGAMENQKVTMGDASQTINKNQFKRPGYSFAGWTLIPAPSDTVYTDCQPITTDFTDEDGATVTLYAQWTVCKHVDYLVYTADGSILTQSCSNCGGHTATATLSAVNAVYDEKAHLATASYSANWLGQKPEIAYEMAASEWDDKDTADEDWQANPKPLHAGNYTAKLTAGGATAQAEYVISPVKWATPTVPQISFKVEKNDVGTYNSIITITTPTGDNLVYKITQLHNDGTEIGVEGYLDWRSENEFSNIPYGKYYYFYAKVCADRDHTESDPSKSSAYLTTGGNIIYIKNDEGIKVKPTYGTGEFMYTVSADVGYHLRGYHDNLTDDNMEIGTSPLPTFVEQIPGVQSGDAHIEAGGITISKAGPTDGAYTYTVKLVEGKVTYHQITLEFSGAAKNAAVASKVTDGEVFGDFNSKDTSISRDSAFTAQFTVSDYIPDEYTEQKLSFSAALPAGTTIIMKVDGGYWYYNLGAADESAIKLTDFKQMGGGGEFSFNTTEDSAKTFTYQFIVDFSEVADGRLSPGSLNVSLVLTAKSTPESAPNIPADGYTHISLDIKEEARFGLTSTGSGGKSATFSCTYTPSLGAASIWDGRKTSLVLTATSTVPADLTLTAVVDGNTTLYTMNANRQFIVPLGEIGTKNVTVTLNSDLFGLSADSLTFTAVWYVSESVADKSPLNGYKAASASVSFSGKKDAVPSVRIDGTERLCHAGGKLEVTVKYSGIPDGGTVTAYLQRKNGEQYVDTGAKDLIKTDAADVTDAVMEKKTDFNMGQMANGSYRILVIVQESDANILQVPYYFVIS